MIRGPRAAMPPFLSELFAYRVLIQSLVLRDLKARYRGSALGFFWTFLNPALLMGTYMLIFSVYMRLQMENYAAFLLTGLLPWLWFSSSLLVGGASVMQGGDLLKTVSFPPQVLPAVSVTANLVNFLLSLPLLFGVLLLCGIRPGWTIVALVPIVATQLVLTYGLTLLVSALTVRYRDVTPLLGNVLTLWFFLSPVVYPAAQVPEALARFFLLNPMAPLLMGYQAALLDHAWPPASSLAFAAVVAITAMIVGEAVFDRLRWTFAEQV